MYFHAFPSNLNNPGLMIILPSPSPPTLGKGPRFPFSSRKTPDWTVDVLFGLKSWKEVQCLSPSGKASIWIFVSSDMFHSLDWTPSASLTYLFPLLVRLKPWAGIRRFSCRVGNLPSGLNEPPFTNTFPQSKFLLSIQSMSAFRLN